MSRKSNRTEDLTTRQGILAFAVISAAVLTFCGFVVASPRVVEVASQIGYLSIILLTAPLAVMGGMRALHSADPLAMRQTISHAVEIIVGVVAFWIAPLVFRTVWGA